MKRCDRVAVDAVREHEIGPYAVASALWKSSMTTTTFFHLIASAANGVFR